MRPSTFVMVLHMLPDILLSVNSLDVLERLKMSANFDSAWRWFHIWDTFVMCVTAFSSVSAVVVYLLCYCIWCVSASGVLVHLQC